MLAEAEFASVAERHRHELHAYCRRLLGSPEQAEDAVQDTLLRAWRSRGRLQRREWVRAWLYTIARNACIDRIAREARRVPPAPDVPVEEPAGDDPHVEVVDRETLELTVLAAIDLLPPRQRDAVILCDLLDFRPADAAGLLGTRTAAVNSSLQRARRTLREHLDVDARDQWGAPSATHTERQVVGRFVDAHGRGDARAAYELIAEGVLGV